MNEPKSEYLLLFRNNAWYQQLSPEEIQRVMTDWMSWFDGLVAEGRCLGGQSLEHDGHVVRGAHRSVTDGPYAETKEQLGGILILEADDLNHAIQLMSKHPGVKAGPFEIRPAEDMTPYVRESEERRRAAATA